MVDEQDKLNEARRRFERLHQQAKSLVLGTVDADSQPRASYAPFVRDESGRFYIFVSRLSDHTAELIDNPVASVMLIEDETDAGQIFARMRTTYMCDVGVIDPSSECHGNILDRLTERFGGVVDLLRSLPDFVLLQLVPRSGRFVTGFGQAYDLTGKDLGELRHVGPVQIKPG